MVRIEFAIAGQALQEKFQFLHQFAFRKRREFPAAGFFQERRPGEQRESAGAYQHGLQLVENFRCVDSVIFAVLAACHAVQEGDPVLDSGIFQLVALLQNIFGGVALVDAFQP